MDRKEAILDAGLKLFAEQGYHRTPTRQIAVEAGVSEGLIFKHFENKEGLLREIFEAGNARLAKLSPSLLDEKDPKEILRKFIEFPIRVVDASPDFWRLQYAIKWLDPALKKSIHTGEAMQQLNQKAFEAFSKLAYPSPQQETLFFSLLLEGLMSLYLQEGKTEKVQNLIGFIQDKYNCR